MRKKNRKIYKRKTLKKRKISKRKTLKKRKISKRKTLKKRTRKSYRQRGGAEDEAVSASAAEPEPVPEPEAEPEPEPEAEVDSRQLYAPRPPTPPRPRLKRTSSYKSGGAAGGGQPASALKNPQQGPLPEIEPGDWVILSFPQESPLSKFEGYPGRVASEEGGKYNVLVPLRDSEPKLILVERDKITQSPPPHNYTYIGKDGSDGVLHTYGITKFAHDLESAHRPRDRG